MPHHHRVPQPAAGDRSAGGGSSGSAVGVARCVGRHRVGPLARRMPHLGPPLPPVRCSLLVPRRCLRRLLLPSRAPKAKPHPAGAPPRPAAGPLSLLDALLLISPFFFWGTSMVAMKQLAPHTTPLLVASWRLIPAGAVLLLWAQRSGRKAPTDPQAWLVVALFGLVDGAAFQVGRAARARLVWGGLMVRHAWCGRSRAARVSVQRDMCPPVSPQLPLTPPTPPLPTHQGFLAEGLQRTSAGLGSVIIDSQPLSVALLAALLFGEELGGGGVAGLFLGVAGLCLLELPPSVLAALPDSFAAGALQLAAGSSGGDAASAAAALGSDAASAAAAALGGGDASSGGGAPWNIWDSGEWWMLLAAQSMAVGTVMVRWVAKYCDPVVATGWHMVLGGLPLLAVAAWQEGPEALERLSLLTGEGSRAWEGRSCCAAFGFVCQSASDLHACSGRPPLRPPVPALRWPLAWPRCSLRCRPAAVRLPAGLSRQL